MSTAAKIASKIATTIATIWVLGTIAGILYLPYAVYLELH